MITPCYMGSVYQDLHRPAMIWHSFEFCPSFGVLRWQTETFLSYCSKKNLYLDQYLSETY